MRNLSKENNHNEIFDNENSEYEKNILKYLFNKDRDDIDIRDIQCCSSYYEYFCYRPLHNDVSNTVFNKAIKSSLKDQKEYIKEWSKGDKNILNSLILRFRATDMEKLQPFERGNYFHLLIEFVIHFKNFSRMGLGEIVADHANIKYFPADKQKHIQDILSNGFEEIRKRKSDGHLLINAILAKMARIENISHDGESYYSPDTIFTEDMRKEETLKNFKFFIKKVGTLNIMDIIKPFSQLNVLIQESFIYGTDYNFYKSREEIILQCQDALDMLLDYFSEHKGSEEDFDEYCDKFDIKKIKLNPEDYSYGDEIPSEQKKLSSEVCKYFGLVKNYRMFLEECFDLKDRSKLDRYLKESMIFGGYYN